MGIAVSAAIFFVCGFSFSVHAEEPESPPGLQAAAEESILPAQDGGGTVSELTGTETIPVEMTDAVPAEISPVYSEEANGKITVSTSGEMEIGTEEKKNDPGQTVTDPEPEEAGQTVTDPEPEKSGQTVTDPEPEEAGQTVTDPEPEEAGQTVTDPEPTKEQEKTSADLAAGNDSVKEAEPEKKAADSEKQEANSEQKENTAPATAKAAAAPKKAPVLRSSAPRQLQITKRWNDAGHESERPETVTIEIYDAGDMSQPVQTITLSASDISAENGNEWVKQIELPDEDDSGNKITYVLKEKGIEGYVTGYETPDSAVDIELSEDTEFLAHPDGEFIDSKFRVYRYNNDKDEWAYYWEESTSRAGTNEYGSDIAGDLRGKTLHFNDSTFFPTDRADISYLQYTEAKNYVDLVGDEFIDVKYFDFGDSYVWRYTPALGSKYTYYLVYTGDSWYGGKFHTKKVTMPLYQSVVINTFNKADILFQKEWDDAGFEDSRPDSVTIDLYSDQQSEPVSTAVLDVTKDPSVKLQEGVFKDLPIYTEDGKKIGYYIKENTPDGYKAVYDVVDGVGYGHTYNGLEVTFGKTSGVANLLTDEPAYMNIPRRGYSYGVYKEGTDYISERKIVIPMYGNVKPSVSVINWKAFEQWQILDVKPAVVDAAALSSSTSYASSYGSFYYEPKHNYFESTGKTYLNITPDDLQFLYSDMAFYYKYIWSGLPDPFVGGLKVINRINRRNVEVTKRWNDEGHEDERPESVEIEYYRADDPDTLAGTLTLTKDDIPTGGKSNEWVGSLSLPDEDENGNKIIYTLKEKPVDGYLTSYDTQDSAVDIYLSDDTQFWYSYQYVAGTIKLYRYDEENDKWYYYWERENDNGTTGLPNDYYSISGDLRSHVFHLNDSTFFPASRRPYELDVRIAYTDEKNVIELVGDSFVEVDKFDIVDYYIWKYVPAIGSRYSYYLIYDGDSWEGGTFHTDKVEIPEYRPIVINTWNKQDVECEKEWDDAGYEQYRPGTVTLDLYSDHSPETVLDSITLTVTDANTLKGVFKDLPIYGDDQKKIQYYIQERDVPDYYKAVYDVIGGVGYGKAFNAIAVTFGETSDYAYVVCDKPAYKQLYQTTNSTRETAISYRTILFPMFTNNPSFTILNWAESFDKWEITDIRPGVALPAAYSLSWDAASTIIQYMNPEKYDVFYASYDDFLNVTSDDITKSSVKRFAYEYTWKGLLHPFANGLKVRNVINASDLPFAKTWDEGEYAAFRPDKVTFELYNVQDDKKPVQTVELTRDALSDTDKNLWEGHFSLVPMYNEDGSPAEYYVIEKVPDGYTPEVYANTSTRKKTGAMKVTFGDDMRLYGPGYLYYYDEEGNPFYVSMNSGLAGQTVVVPANEFYVEYMTNQTYLSYNTYYPNYTLDGWFTLADISSTTDGASAFTSMSKESFANMLSRNFGEAGIREMYGASSWTPEDYLRYGNAVYLHFTAGEQAEPFAGSNYIKNKLTEIPFKAVVIKKDDAEAELAGASLKITGRWSKGSKDIDPIEWVSSDLEGKTILLLPGTYVLEEVEVPEGYLSAEPITFTIAEDGTVTVNGEKVSEVVMIDEKKPEEPVPEETEKPEEEKPEPEKPEPEKTEPEKPEPEKPAVPEKPVPVFAAVYPGVPTGDSSHAFAWLAAVLAAAGMLAVLMKKKRTS